MTDVRLSCAANHFKLRGPLVTATHVEVVVDGIVKRLDSVRVPSEAVKQHVHHLTGDPSIDKFSFLMYGALDKLGFSFDECQVIVVNKDIIKLRAYGVEEKKNANTSS